MRHFWTGFNEMVLAEALLAPGDPCKGFIIHYEAPGCCRLLPIVSRMSPMRAR